MISIPFTAANYPPKCAIANGNGSLDISWAELVWAAITVGKRSWRHVLQHGPFSRFEMVYRGAMIYANLIETPSGNAYRSSAYEGLDPSEKSAISYFLGLAVSKAFVAKTLRVPWLMHVDIYREQFGLQLVPFGGRPDLFGRDRAGRWVVLEAKGRTNGHDEAALQRAKTQASLVEQIDGKAPYLSIGLVSSFANGRLSLVTDDPAPKKPQSKLRWQVTEDEFLAAYYQPFRAMFEQIPTRVEQISGRRVILVESDFADLSIGVAENALSAPDVNSLTADDEKKSGEHGVIAEKSGEREFLGIDGVFVRLGASWSDGLMRLEPQVRQA
jgi:hypothetical protein